MLCVGYSLVSVCVSFCVFFVRWCRCVACFFLFGSLVVFVFVICLCVSACGSWFVV